MADIHDLSTMRSSENDSVDKLLSKSLMQLNFEDRNDIREEIHGVRSLEREETPELIEESLRVMDTELNKIISSSEHSHAFKVARSLTNSYVNSREFRLKFLRSEFFDPVKAADRMIVNLDYQQHLFGPRSMAERVNTTFFNSEEMTALREGYIQLLPFRDRAGRQVLVLLAKALTYKPMLRCKIVGYLMESVSEDLENQRKGIVILVWGGSTDPADSAYKFTIPGSPGYHERVVLRSGRTIDEAMPLRPAAYHMCFPDTPLYRLMKSFWMFSARQSLRYPRITIHTGGRMEMRYKLSGYGIPVSHIPDTDTGAVKLKNHAQWLKLRKRIENDPSLSVSICECPGLNDVCFRRAGSCSAHPGNSRFKNLIEAKKDEHNISNQTEKKNISVSILQEIERRNGRFFKWSKDQTCWIQITDPSEIHTKVAMSIRDFNRKAKAAHNRVSVGSSTNLFQPEYEKNRKRKNFESCRFAAYSEEPVPYKIGRCD